MNLKDTLEIDLSNVFFNADEFAEVAIIDGNKVLVVIDEQKLNGHSSKSGGEGLISNGLLFHVQKDELPFDPYPGKDVVFNGKFYYISDVKKPMGMFSITLEVMDT